MWVPQVAAAADVVAVATEQNAWLIGDDDEVIVIDPGESADVVLEQVGDRQVVAVICTHGHARHIAAALEVVQRDAQRFAAEGDDEDEDDEDDEDYEDYEDEGDEEQAPIALHRSDRFFWRSVHPAADPDIEMADGGRFEVSDATLEVIHTPGHTAGSVSLYCADLGVVFTGDALAAAGPVPHEGDFPDFAAQLTAIGERLLDLPAATRVLPGHGEESTIGDAAKQFDSWVTAGPNLGQA